MTMGVWGEGVDVLSFQTWNNSLQKVQFFLFLKSWDYLAKVPVTLFSLCAACLVPEVHT